MDDIQDYSVLHTVWYFIFVFIFLHLIPNLWLQMGWKIN